VLEVDEIFAGYEVNQKITLAQSHNDYIKKDSIDAAGFLLLADSPSCEVEAVKHKRYPFYGSNSTQNGQRSKIKQTQKVIRFLRISSKTL